VIQKFNSSFRSNRRLGKDSKNKGNDRSKNS
jgi:hypothetical protein